MAILLELIPKISSPNVSEMFFRVKFYIILAKAEAFARLAAYYSYAEKTNKLAD
jgi:hypothetical protein